MHCAAWETKRPLFRPYKESGSKYLQVKYVHSIKRKKRYSLTESSKKSYSQRGQNTINPDWHQAKMPVWEVHTIQICIVLGVPHEYYSMQMVLDVPFSYFIILIPFVRIEVGFPSIVYILYLSGCEPSIAPIPVGAST